MKKDKIKVYILELILVGFLFFTLFASNIINRYILAAFLFIYVFIVYALLKKIGVHSIHKKQVTILMSICALVYLAIFYALGLYFGYVETKIKISFNTLLKFIIPFSIIIISSELIRRKLLAQDGSIKIRSKKINLSVFFTTVAMVLVDMLVYTGTYNLSELDNVLTILGFVLFSSLSCNLLFNYITTRYGSKGIIIFRLITMLYIYIIPFESDIFMFLKIFIRMLIPYLIYLLLESTYSKTNFAESMVEKRKNVVSTTIAMIILVLLIMLISCQFRFGILVIGSRSMTGTINIGDAVIYERYDDQIIEKGQIIIFEYNNTLTVHRVVDIRRVNGEYRYITKGDYNKSIDDAKTTDKDIKGLVKLKIKYIGQPTLWLRSLFE